MKSNDRIPSTQQWYHSLAQLIDSTKNCQADELAWLVNVATKPLGLELTFYIIDHEQRQLHALPEKGKPTAESIQVDGTVAGHAFMFGSPVQSGPPIRWWVPLVDGSERLGVVSVTATGGTEWSPSLLRRCEVLIGLAGHLVTTKMPYGDQLRLVRRTRPMSPASELILAMLPPLTFTSPRAVITALVEPAYDVGGDGFDYAVDGATAHLAVFDAMGHGLSAATTGAVALSALRAARREGASLTDMAQAADQAIIHQFGDLRFVTCLLAELNVETGHLRLINAGHWPPLLIRKGRALKDLTGGNRLPLGLGSAPPEPAVEAMEPGDWLLLYTDGVIEARNPEGELFGIERLISLIERQAASDLSAAETLRRLGHHIVAYQDGPLHDDATMMLVEWRGHDVRHDTDTTGM